MPSSPRVALIPGGARGIGRAVALRLARDGWAVALATRRSRAELEATAAAIRAAGGDALPLLADVSQPDACARAVADAVAWRGRLDALIHCAGPYHRVDLLQETPEGWREMFAHNLDGFFYMARATAPVMQRQRAGRIVAFSMANADRLAAQTQVTAHYLAKAGVLGLVRALAKALAKDNVTVNAVSPGFIDSGSMDPGELAGLAKSIPAGRIGSVDDVVAAVAYLLSEDAAYVTGGNLQVSGGWGI